MTVERIKHVSELTIELLRISRTDEVRNTRLFALALAYLLNEIIPKDRTTGRVEENAWKE